jgi:integrase
VKRAAALLTVYEREEEKIVNALENNTVSPCEARALLTEMLRAELAQILTKEEDFASWTDRALDERIRALEAENASLRRAARQGNWASVQVPIENASKLISASLPDAIPSSLGRQAVSLKRRLNEVEMEVLDGEDVRQAAKPLLIDHGSQNLDEFVRAPVLISHAWQQTLKNYPTKSMQPNINGIGRLATEFFGDIPVTSISKERQKDFFVWLAQLPRSHGKSHGKNRYTAKAKVITKNFEISEADAHDFEVTERIRGRNDISIPEKRAMLAEELTPRVTMANIRKLRDSLNRIFKGAGDLGIDPPVALSYRDVEKAINVNAPQDQLYVRVTKPKIRMPWSEERLAAFLTCPIYTGAASEHRRWKTGSIIIRDATYWVPLIVLSLGTRIEEILLLKRRDVRYRNGIYCLAVGTGPEQSGKTEDSQRVVPIPQILLDLGFVQWFQCLTEEHGPLLFPEAAARSEAGDASSAFGKHIRRILARLDLGDFDEDFYALRKTFSSMLRSAQVQDGQRQAIAGHKHGNILNIHYTAHKTKDLKRSVDLADFKLQIGKHPEYEFPTILGCNLAQGKSLKVEVTLTEKAEAASIIIYHVDDNEPVFEFVRQDDCPTSALNQAAKELRGFVSEHPLILPHNALKRAAFEHLQALA